MVRYLLASQHHFHSLFCTLPCYRAWTCGSYILILSCQKNSCLIMRGLRWEMKGGRKAETILRAAASNTWSPEDMRFWQQFWTFSWESTWAGMQTVELLKNTYSFPNPCKPAANLKANCRLPHPSNNFISTNFILKYFPFWNISSRFFFDQIFSNIHSETFSENCQMMFSFLCHDIYKSMSPCSGPTCPQASF